MSRGGHSKVELGYAANVCRARLPMAMSAPRPQQSVERCVEPSASDVQKCESNGGV